MEMFDVLLEPLHLVQDQLSNWKNDNWYFPSVADHRAWIFELDSAYITRDLCIAQQLSYQ